MINVVIDYLSIPLALRSIIKNLHFDMPSIMLISLLLESPNDLKTNQQTKMNIQVLSKGTSYESKQ